MADDRSRLQATVEDCVDEDSIRPSHEDDLPQPANVHVKRSKGSDLDRQAPTEPPLASGTSDVTASSGYSRHTADTMSTADSMGSSRPKNPTSRSKTSQEQATESPRKKATKPKQKVEHSSSPRTKEAKPEKSKSKSKPIIVKQDPIPIRSKPIPQIPEREQEKEARRRDEQPRTQRRPSHVDVPAHQRHHFHPEAVQYPYPYHQPQSSSAVQHQPFKQGQAAIQPHHTPQHHHRRSSSTSGRPRPYSYHSAEGAYYGQYGRLPAVDNARGPPPSSSAYASMSAAQGYPAYVQSPQSGYAGLYAAPPAPQGDYSVNPAPPQPRKPSYSARNRPTSMYGATPNASVPQPPAEPKPTGPGFSARQGMYPVQSSSAVEDDYSSSEEEEEEDSLEEAEERAEQYRLQREHIAWEAAHRRALMPPPNSLPNRRGSLHQSNGSCTQPAPFALTYREKPYHDSATSSMPPQSQASSSRTPNTDYSHSSLESKRNQTRDRRPSCTGRRSLKHPDHSEGESSAAEHGERSRRRAPRPPPTDRRRTESDVRRRSVNMDYNHKTLEASKYQLGPEGEELMHTSDTLLRSKTAKGHRPTHLIDQKHASDERSNTSRSSQGRRSTVTKDARGAMVIHVQGDDDIKISLDGDMQGKTINLSNTGDGTAVIIGSSRGDGRSYHGGSERSYRDSQKSYRTSEKGLRSRVGSLKEGSRDYAPSRSRETRSRSGRSRDERYG